MCRRHISDRRLQLTGTTIVHPAAADGVLARLDEGSRNLTALKRGLGLVIIPPLLAPTLAFEQVPADSRAARALAARTAPPAPPSLPPSPPLSPPLSPADQVAYDDPVAYYIMFEVFFAMVGLGALVVGCAWANRRARDRERAAVLRSRELTYPGLDGLHGDLEPTVSDERF